MTEWIPWFQDPLVGRVSRIAVGLLVIYVVARLATRRLLPRIKDPDARYRTRKVVALIAWIVAGLYLADAWSDRLGGIAVALGVIGAGVAFALQEVIASIAGWMAVLVGGVFRVGDRIQLGGIRGDVIDIGVLRSTLMECGDWVNGDLYNGRIVRVTNSAVFKEPVFNYSADFPFLWDEIRVPVTHASDRAMARQLLVDALQQVVGPYADTAKASWSLMVNKYRIEDAQVTPMVTMIATDNWLEYTARYVVDYRRRRTAKDQLFTVILDAIETTGGRVRLASATVEVVGIPPVEIQDPTRPLESP